MGRSFRLLTELYSFLWVRVSHDNERYYECFRLLTELYSFLYYVFIKLHNGQVFEFPSPYGVIFILILSNIT